MPLDNPMGVEERDSRWAKVRNEMERKGIDCLVVYGTRNLVNHTASFRYLSRGVEGYLVFPLEGEPTIFPFFGHKGRGDWFDAWVKDLRNCHPFYSKGIVERIRELKLENGVIGIVSSDRYWREYGFPHHTYLELTSALKDAKFVETSDLLEEIRLVKSPAEIQCLENAAAIGAEVIDTIRKSAKVGGDHREVKKRAMDTLYELGAEPGKMFLYSFGDSITHGGVKAFFVDIPGRKEIKANEVILTEFSIYFQGYEAQYNQPFVAGRPSKEWQAVFNACSEAYDRGYKALKPGIKAGELEDVCLAPILKAGYTYSNPMFHGLGFALEQPIGTIPWQPLHVLDRLFMLRKDIVLEIEPHAMTSDLKYGMSLGDTVVVTDSGCRRLGKKTVPEFVSTG